MRIARIAVFLLATTAFAQTAGIPSVTQTQDQSSYTCFNCFTLAPSPPEPMIQINGEQIIKINDKDGKLMVNIALDGKVTYGEGYKPDDSAKLFWQKLGEAYPEMCVQYERRKKEKEEKPAERGKE